MTTLLKDVITIPERTGAEDYVLRLTDSVGEDSVAATMASYVVTPALAEAFDAALGLVGESITSGVSRGAFLSGSFGAGKSHFMAVLHALLTRQPAARATRELQPVIAAHDPQLESRRILPLAFHLLEAASLEQALFDGYVRQIRSLHPSVPLPPLYQADALLDDADTMRPAMGDQTFFHGLNGSSPSALTSTAATSNGSSDPWGGVLGGTQWSAAAYDTARSADPSSPDRHQLVSALASARGLSMSQVSRSEQ